MSVDARASPDERMLAVGRVDGASVPVTTVPQAQPARVSNRWPRAAMRLSAGRVGAAASLEIERGVPFHLAPVCMGGGAASYFTAAHEPAWTTLVVALGIVASLAWLSRHSQAARLLMMALIMALLGVLAAKLEVTRAGTTITGSPVATTVTGSVIRVEHRANGRVRLTLDVLKTERPVLRYAPERVRLTARAVPAGLAPGSTVVGYARLMPPSGPVRPGGYDFAFESYFDRIGAIGFYLGDPRLAETTTRQTVRQSMAAWIERARLAIAARVRQHIGADAGEVAAALIAGVRSGIPEPVNEALRRTGLAHILAISGLHMALVAATVLVAIRSIAALFPDLVARHPVKKYAAAAALMVCALYLAVSGAAVAAQRSFIMLAVMLIALLFDRAALTLRNLAIAALIILAIAPHEIMGPSFQMSFAATAALIGGYALWSEHRFRAHARQSYRQRGLVALSTGRLLKLVGGLAATSIIAGLATTVFGIYHFNRVSPLALGANMLAMPLVTFCVMPMAVFSMALMPLGLEGLPLAVMGWGLRAVIATAQWFSDMTTIDAIGTMPAPALLAFTLALTAGALLTTWLRLVAVPLFVLGMGLQMDRRLPDVLVSEDARLVAIRGPDGQLAVNRDRPNAFTLNDWLRSQGTDTWLKPEGVAEGEGAGATSAPRFHCDDDTCMAGLAGGGYVLHTQDSGIAGNHCAGAMLIVITDATVGNICPKDGAVVVTARDTARKGSLAAYVQSPGQPGDQDGLHKFEPQGVSASRPSRLLTLHAVAEPYRRWHTHRQYSREARGMPPYRRQSNDD